MDFLANAWNTVKGDAAGFWDWFKRSPIADFNAGFAFGTGVSDKVTGTVTAQVKKVTSAAGNAVGGTLAGTLWSTVLPLLPLLIIAGVGYYFIRRRGGF